MVQITTKMLAIYAADQLKAGISPQKLVDQVAAFLVSERRSGDVKLFSRLLQAERSRRGIGEITISSIVPIPETVKQQLAKKMDIKHPVFHEVIDAKIIGGIIASTSESTLDLSIAHKLTTFVHHGGA